MTPQERELIADLYRRLQSVANTPVDDEAKAHIERLAAEQPHALYALTQTTLVQEHALKGAQARITELEAKLAESAAPKRSFLAGLLGEERPAAAATGGPWGRAQPPAVRPEPQYTPAPMAPQPGPWSAAAPATGGGPSFLRSAMTTAAGVAGGALLFQGIQSMLGHSGGPFGGGFGATSAMAQQPEVVVNNYYDQRTTAPDSRDDDPDATVQDASLNDDDTSYDDSSSSDDQSI